MFGVWVLGAVSTYTKGVGKASKHSCQDASQHIPGEERLPSAGVKKLSMVRGATLKVARCDIQLYKAPSQLSIQKVDHA